MRIGIFAVFSLAGFLSLTVQAQTSDLIGTVGQYGFETGSRGAVINRQIADQLYQQALRDEQEARKTFPPNVGLLFKALQETKDAKAADDQAREFARAALHASNSGSKSGEFVNSRYGMIDESKLRELSTTSSPYMSQVEKTLGQYGMKLSADKTSLQTPFGKFSVNPDDSALMKVAMGVAGKLGLSSDAAAEGLLQARAARDSIAQRTVAAIDRDLKGRVPAAEEVERSRSESENSPLQGRGPLPVAEASQAANPAPTLEDQELSILERRRLMGLEIGIEGDLTPIGRPSQDIFKMINSRYQSINSRGQFLPR